MTDKIWRVYEYGDSEWWMCENPDQVMDEIISMHGGTKEEIMEDMRELPEKALHNFKYQDDDGIRTFAEELTRRLAINPKPQFFAGEL